MKPVNKNDLVDSETIKLYSEIDGLKVIEEALLFKGEQIAGEKMCVSDKLLIDTALVTYGLKSNATNKLYVGLHLDRIYRRLGLSIGTGKVKVPKPIYDRVKELNDSYRTKDNQIDE